MGDDVPDSLPTVPIIPAPIVPQAQPRADSSEFSEWQPTSDDAVVWLPDHDALRPGSMFGRYLVERRLGAGAMGVVVLVRDTALNRLVALKIPRFDSPDPEFRQRFLREARSAALLRHRNICPIHDVGEIAGVLHFTMAYIEGTPLSQLIESKRRFRLRTVAILTRKLARALAEAHQAGLIHRDIKPGNILIDRQTEPVLLDFGLARSYTQRDQRFTPSGQICGTPAYMSPEQVLGRMGELGPATDIYSLGIVFYEMLTGKRPFSGSLGDVLSAILDRPPVEPRLLRVGLDPALEAICLKMIAKSPADRFAAMADVKQALTAYLRETPSQR